MIPRSQILLWLTLYMAAIPGVCWLHGLIEFDGGGFGLLWMMGGTLLPGMVLGAVGLIWPVRWLWIPVGILSIVHLALGLGLHPDSSL